MFFLDYLLQNLFFRFIPLLLTWQEKNRITDLKSTSKGVNQKNKFCKDNLKKKKIVTGIKQNSHSG
jgi:hypothetical protein